MYPMILHELSTAMQNGYIVEMLMPLNTVSIVAWFRGIKYIFMLTSIEHEINPAHKCILEFYSKNTV